MRMSERITNERLFKFSLLILSVSLLVVFMSGGIVGNDFWWHIKVGEYVCDTGTVPQTDIFSWYGIEHDVKWTAHEWLGDVILYKLFSFGGDTVIFIFSILMAVAFNVLIWFEVKKYVYQKLVLTSYFLITLAVTSSLFFYGRPQVFGFFFVYAELKILYAFLNNTEKCSVYFIPLIAWLWSNIYGGSSNLSYIMCGIFILASLFDFRYGKIEGIKLEKKALIKLLVVMICTIGAIAINPIGVQVLKYPYVNLSDSLSMSYISEWKAPDAKLIGNLVLFFLPIAATLIGFIQSEKKVKFVDLLIAGVFILLFLRSVRFIMLWYIAAVVSSIKYLPDGPKLNLNGAKIRIAILLIILVCTLPLYSGITSVYQTCKNGEAISVAMCDEAVEAVKGCKPARLFNDYDLGETLIYNEIPVFFDARADLYSKPGILQDGLELMSMQPLSNEADKKYIEVDKLIEKYYFDYILIKKSRPLFAYLTSTPESFSIIYEDENVCLFSVGRK